MDFKKYLKLKDLFSKDKDKLGYYEHYKGGIYKILNLAYHTEDNDVLVLYKSEENDAIFARPYHIFFSHTKDGVQRFKRIDK